MPGHERVRGPLDERLVAMGARAERALDLATQALERRREVRLEDLARLEREVSDLERETVELIAHAARDVRSLVASFEVERAVERLCEKALDLARSAVQLLHVPAPDVLIPILTERAWAVQRTALALGLDGLARRATRLADGARELAA